MTLLFLVLAVTIALIFARSYGQTFKSDRPFPQGPLLVQELTELRSSLLWHNSNVEIITFQAQKPRDICRGLSTTACLWTTVTSLLQALPGFHPPTLASLHFHYLISVNGAAAVRNVGVNWNFAGWWSKIIATREYLKRSGGGRRLVVFADSDVRFAGCTASEFESRFLSIVNATGARVVFGAEYTCFQIPDLPGVSCTKYPDSKRGKVLDAFGIGPETLDYWCKKDASAPGPCQYKYLNSGFVVGYSDDLLNLYEEWWRYYMTYSFIPTEAWWKDAPSDQCHAHKLLVQRPNVVTLDYAGALVNNLHQLDHEKEGKKPFELRKTGGRRHWWNKAINRSACFMHPNGGSESPFDPEIALEWPRAKG